MNSQTLKENKEFRRLYYRGESKASPALVTYASRSKRPCCRYGITASKKIGGAVERNRARRVIRAAYRELEPSIQGSWDFVFVARTKTTTVKMQRVKQEMQQHFAAMGITDESNQ